jgi:porin
MPQVASQDQTVPQISNQQPINEVRQLSRRTNYIARVTSVSKLSDVQPSDWAFQALQSLIERYGVIEGYPDGTFRGNRAMTRYEFAAALNAALDRVSELINAGLANQISRQDLETLQRLQEEFAKELKVLVGRVDSLEARTARMEATQFSTTTKLNGEAIFAINGGIGNPGGRETDPNTIFFSRVRLNLTTSFTGRDQLLTQLQASTSTPVARLSRVAGVGTDAAGSLADNASALFYSSLIGGTGFQLSRLNYTFPLSNDLKVSIFPRGFASDYIDFNRYSNKRNPDNFSTEALTNNILLFAQDFPSAGAAVAWNINNGPLTFRAVYAAQDATVPEPTGLTNLPAGLGSITDVYGNPRGDNRGGLFGDPYLGFLELEFAPSTAFAVRLQYVDGAQGGKKYRAVGANFEYAISPNLGVFGRFGYAPEFTPIPIPGIEPTYWQAGVAVSDLFVPRDSGGISVAQPLIFQDPITGTDRTQTNYEVFYNFPVGNNIRITPLVQIITDPLNNSENGTIYTGTLRTVFSF